MPGHRRPAQKDLDGPRSLSGAKEHEPDHTQDQNGKAGGDYQEREHRRPGFGLPRLGRGFDDLTFVLHCHGSLNPLSGGAVFGRSTEGQRLISDHVPAFADRDAAIAEVGTLQPCPLCAARYH
jgi:hypothetical protein